MDLGGWGLVSFAAFQLYCTVLLLRLERSALSTSMAVLFLFNGLITIDNVVADRWGFLDWKHLSTSLDHLTNGLMVLTAELAASRLVPRRAASWSLRVLSFPVAALLAGAPFLGSVFGGGGGYTYAAFGYVALRLTHARIRVSPGTPQHVWIVFLLVAFAARILEFVGEAARHASRDSVEIFGTSLMVAGAISLLAFTAFDRRNAPGAVLFFGAPAGLILAMVRYLEPVRHDMLVYFSLAVLRPAGILAGMVHHEGFLGMRLPPARLGLEIASLAAGIASFGLCFEALPSLPLQLGVSSIVGLAVATIAFRLGKSVPRWSPGRGLPRDQAGTGPASSPPTHLHGGGSTVPSSPPKHPGHGIGDPTGQLDSNPTSKTAIDPGPTRWNDLAVPIDKLKGNKLVGKQTLQGVYGEILTLSKTGKPVLQKTLVRKEPGRSPAQVSRACSLLERDGYIVRTGWGFNNRRIYLSGNWRT